MRASYYDVDDILAEAEAVPVTWRHNAYGLGYLDVRSDEEDLKTGSLVELPYWLACVMHRRQHVQIEQPSCFGNKFRTGLLADPTVVNLQDKCPYWYELGLKLALLLDERAREWQLALMLRRSLYSRYLEILRRSPQQRSEETARFRARLANLESILFDVKFHAAFNLTKWTKRQSSKLGLSDALSSVRGSSSSSSSSSAGPNRSPRKRTREQRDRGGAGGSGAYGRGL